MAAEEWFPEIFGGLHDTASLVTLYPPADGPLAPAQFQPPNHHFLRYQPRWKFTVSLPSSLLCGSDFPRAEAPLSSTTAPILRRRVDWRLTRLHQSTHQHGLLTSAPSSQPWSFSYFRLLAGYSQSPELDVHPLANHMPGPTAQTLLLSGILRALGDHQAMVDDSKLKTFCSDQSLTRSLKSPPSTHSNKVLD